VVQSSALSEQSSVQRQNNRERPAVKYNCEPLVPVAGEDNQGGPSVEIDASEEEFEFKEQNKSR